MSRTFSSIHEKHWKEYPHYIKMPDNTNPQHFWRGEHYKNQYYQWLKANNLIEGVDWVCVYIEKKFFAT